MDVVKTDNRDIIKKEDGTLWTKDGKQLKEAILVDLDQMEATVLQMAARAAHEANRVYCNSLGDDTQLPWEESPDWLRESVVKGVLGIKNNPALTSAQSHSMWVAHKLANGWGFGELKDPEAKTHPRMVPYDKLPKNQQLKDALFGAVVRGVLGVKQ